MKKLLVTAIGAAAALGASAAGISTQRFENVTGELPQAATISSLNTLAGGTFWSGDELTNTYTFVSCAGEDFPTEGVPVATPTKALEVKTTFGSPLTLNAVSGGSSTTIPASGIYFDSLVKFTVCEEEPEQSYSGAKIIMWLQEEYASDGDTVLGTNIMVRASYVNANGTCTPTNFVCYKFDGDIDAWHRVTIKTWADITNGSGIPGFAIFIDNELLNTVSAEGTMADAIAANLTEAAGHLGKTKVFASLVQGDATGKDTITSASFDGTGKLTDLVFTDEAPFDAARDWESDKANVYDENGDPIEGSPFKKLADAVAAVNKLDSGTYTFQLANGIALTEPLAFTSEADIVLDFAGFVLTNDLGVAAITNNSANLVITNSVGVGGIYCVDYDSEDVDAIYNIGTLTIGGGTFWGLINVDPDGQNPYITGGTFQEDVAQAGWLAEGKTTQETADGLYEVIDIVYYTVGFYDDVQGEGSLIGTEASVEAGTLATAPAAPTKTGYTFVDWTPSTNVAITADTNFYPTWSANSYTITYYDGENVLDLAPASYTYGTGVTLPASAGAKTGYTFAGWYDNAGLTGDPVTAVAASETGNQTFYAKYTADTYMITFVNEIGDDPASTNYTIESGAITLPTATTSNVGVQFDGWTNGTYTTATNIFTPSAANLADFTLYAAWSSTGSSGFDGGDTTFTIDPGAQATVEAKLPAGKTLSDTVAGSSVTYAQAYALGLVDTSGEVVEVADLDATIEIKDGKVVVGLSSTPLSAYTITLKVYEKSSLTAAWPVEPTQTYTLDSGTATTGFAPAAGGTNFYKTEVSISNK